jgi:hypothetical protein
MPRSLAVVAVLLAVAPPARSTPASAPLPVAVSDIDGRRWTPFDPAAGEISLLVFVAADCPISNRYAPEIDRIAVDYASKRVRTFLVYTDRAIDAARVRGHLKDFHPGSRAPAIVDTTRTLVAAAGATITPEAVVVTSAGRIYRGRIDDLYVSTGSARRAAQQHDLRDALEAAVAGRPAAHAETAAVGCYIEMDR